MKRNHQGTSLIELIIVVLVMGILAAAASPRFGKAIARAKCESVARRIAADINYARQVAMQTSRNTTILFVASPPCYNMTNVVHPHHPSQSYLVVLSEIDSSVLLTTVSFNVSTILTYNTYGRPFATGLMVPLTTGTIVVTLGSEQFTVTVDPNTGEASVT